MKFIVNGQEYEIPCGGVGVSSGGVPKGSIIIWTGSASDIPPGWALCDGQDGRPDLRDRFVLGGGGTHPVGETGGEETHTLTVAEMPGHKHNVVLSNTNYRWTDEITSGPLAVATKNASLDSSIVGGSQPHENMPPYYVLCYIIKITDNNGIEQPGEGSSGEVYSTEETRIGTWIDGKPLYRKVFNVTTPPTTTSAMVADISEPFHLVDLYGHFTMQNGDEVPIPYLSGSNFVSAWLTLTGIKMAVSNNVFVSIPAVIILEYTKTAD